LTELEERFFWDEETKELEEIEQDEFGDIENGKKPVDDEGITNDHFKHCAMLILWI
jgi:hypothetical protein